MPSDNRGSTILTPEQALSRLHVGNQRFAHAHQSHPHEGLQRRHDVLANQHPFAMVLGCVDSRVPPELIFDQGIGDLLTVRTAGEVVDEAVLGSLAYGVEELHVPLIVVLGHQRCGAVTAAVQYLQTHEAARPHLQRLIDQISPAVRCRSEANCVDDAIKANVRHVCELLATDAELAPTIKAGQLRVVGAEYALDTGEVDFRIYHPHSQLAIQPVRD